MTTLAPPAAGPPRDAAPAPAPRAGAPARRRAAPGGHGRGRPGSLAGPVSVGVVVVDVTTRSAPKGVADSKLLAPAARTRLLPALGRWGLARAVGHASAAEIDEVGIIAALRLAGTRALAAVAATVGPVDVVLLDGSHDWLSRPAQADLFTARRASRPCPHRACTCGSRRTGPCASVAAASVLAKCERDAMMVDLAARAPRLPLGREQGLRVARAHGGAARARPERAAPALLAAARDGSEGVGDDDALLGPVEAHARAGAVLTARPRGVARPRLHAWGMMSR